VYEVKLGDEFLMSSLFTAGEVALADLALSKRNAPLDVLVGGLGLGYTVHAALRYPNVQSLLVVETLADVIDWHRRGLVPLGNELVADPRCKFINRDFFEVITSRGIDPNFPSRRFHAILLDIDHSPKHVLHPSHSGLYQPEGLKRLAAHLHGGGVFALWSNDPPDEEFCTALASVFPQYEAHVVRFPNPLQNREAANTVYVAYI
jgi:spermidine synthase